MRRYLLFAIIFVSSLSLSTAQNFSLKDDLNTIRKRREAERTSNKEIENRIDKIISEMTLEEKIGQMIQITVDVFSDITEYHQNEDGITHIVLDSAKFMQFLTKYPISSIINGYGFTPENWYEFEDKLQKMNYSHTRLKIPIIHSADHQHGANYVHGSTIFPHSLNMGATFNRHLSAEESRITGIESADLGHRWILGPIADLGVNPLWPRIFETYGEDPYLISEMALANLKSRLNNTEIAPYKQVSCVKHFLAYSDPKAGWDRTPTDISDQTLYEFHLPPFKALIDNGINAVMLSSSDLNGKPVHGSYDIVTKLLRDELDFKGVVISDWDDIGKMSRYHKAAKNEKDATLLAINAGIDITMAPYDLDFGDFIMDFIKEGKIHEERIELSVSRILRMKFEAGLFDHPYPRNDRLDRIGKKEHKEIALQAARESIVLLKNENILPIRNSINKIVVTGPNANIKRSLAGGWTYRWNPTTDSIFPEDMLTIYTALQKQLPDKEIILANNDNLNKEITNSDITIIALGELPHAEGTGNINDILLPREQQEIIDIAIQSKKPFIIIMVGARPLIATEGFNNCDAFIWAGLPGIEGAQALAEIITGEANPSGKLSFSYPAFSGHYFNYNHKPSHVLYDIPPRDSVTVIGFFGEGLSYSEFDYSELSLSDTSISFSDSIVAIVKVTNTSKIDGKEAVLWYISDEIASITRPVKALKYFEKKNIEAGKTSTFSFIIKPERDLSFPDKNGKKILEKGYFTISVGDQKAKFKLE